MERWKILQMEQLSHTTEFENAYRVALGIVKNFGFKFLAFSSADSPQNSQPHMFQRNNYPAGWNAFNERQKMNALGQIAARCNRSMLPTLWNEDLFADCPWLWDALEQHGFQHGLSQAVHDDHGVCSILSLARSHCPISAFEAYEILGIVVFISHHLHSVAARSMPRHCAEPSSTRLSDREIDVLKLAAAGKTADESAKILNLSPRTVHFHMQSVIRKLGVHNKISAIIAAIKAGHLSGAEAPGR